jgi:hypothetical protein
MPFKVFGVHAHHSDPFFEIVIPQKGDKQVGIQPPHALHPKDLKGMVQAPCRQCAD